MSSHVRHVHYTYAEYLSLEKESSTRHEYLDGEIYAMAGGTPDHAALAAAVIGLLRAGIPPPAGLLHRICASERRPDFRRTPMQQSFAARPCGLSRTGSR